jgi:hypothetical protein
VAGLALLGAQQACAGSNYLGIFPQLVSKVSEGVGRVILGL